MSYLEMNGSSFSFGVQLADNGLVASKRQTDVLRESGSEIMINGGYLTRIKTSHWSSCSNGKVLGLQAWEDRRYISLKMENICYKDGHIVPRKIR